MGDTTVTDIVKAEFAKANPSIEALAQALYANGDGYLLGVYRRNAAIADAERRRAEIDAEITQLRTGR